jgi:hypothetical protein
LPVVLQRGRGTDSVLSGHYVYKILKCKELLCAIGVGGRTIRREIGAAVSAATQAATLIETALPFPGVRDN